MRRNQTIPMLGVRVGRLLVIRYLPERCGQGAVWLCRCDCGMEVAVEGDKLRAGLKKSCGCAVLPLRQIQLSPRSARRFWTLVEKSASGCWLWRGTIDGDGYGKFGDRRAHRVTYDLVVGQIPNGHVIDHACCVRLCVNPAHLAPVSAGDNSRLTAARQTRCKRGHAFTDDNTYLTRFGRRQCVECARRKARHASA